jgi:hypothetical protein
MNALRQALKTCVVSRHQWQWAGNRESVIVIAVVMVLPSTVPAVVVPSALFAISAVISVAVIDGGRRIDHGRRRLIDDGGWRYIKWRWRAKKYPNVHVSKSSAGSTSSGEAHCE